MEIIADGQIRYLDSGHDSVLAYERTYGQEKLTVVCSLAGEELLLSEPISLEGKKVLLSSYLDEPTGTMTALRPYESIAIYEN